MTEDQKIKKPSLILIDLQEKLWPFIKDKEPLLKNISILLKSFEILKLPIIVTEQYPQGLGRTLSEVQSIISERLSDTSHFEKTHFSCFKDSMFASFIEESSRVSEWVLVGIETHICLLLTALDLLKNGKKVTVIEDATSSRKLENKRIAISELQKTNCRITCTETFLFELLENSKDPAFKSISALVKENE